MRKTTVKSTWLRRLEWLREEASGTHTLGVELQRQSYLFWRDIVHRNTERCFVVVYLSCSQCLWSSEIKKTVVSLLIFGSCSVRGLSGLNCPLHSLIWHPFRMMTDLTAWMRSLAPLLELSLSLQLQLTLSFPVERTTSAPCAHVQRWKHECQHAPPAGMEWGQLKGREEGGVTRLHCKFQGAKVHRSTFCRWTLTCHPCLFSLSEAAQIGSWWELSRRVS